MTDVEVALELTKIILGARDVSLKTENDPKKVVLDLYRDSLAAVRRKLDGFA